MEILDGIGEVEAALQKAQVLDVVWKAVIIREAAG
jgi:hypothetical protein